MPTVISSHNADLSTPTQDIFLLHKLLYMETFLVIFTTYLLAALFVADRHVFQFLDFLNISAVY